MTRKIWVRSVFALVLMLLTGGCMEGKQPTPPSTPPPVTQVVTVAGGTLSLSNGASLWIPPEALDSDVEVTMSVAEEAPPEELKPASPLLRFKPSGTVFARPVKVSIPFSSGLSRPTVYWSKTDGSGYEPIGGEVENGFMVAEVLHFSEGFVAESTGTRTVSGVNNETWVVETEVSNVPRDYTLEEVSALVLGADGKFTKYPGTGKADGTFSIPGVPEGTFYLKTGSTYLVTDQSVLDLGDSYLGRRDTAKPTQPTTLTFNISNLAAWQDGDHLEFFSTRSNTWFFDMETYVVNPPSVDATSLSGLKLITGPGSSYYGIANFVDGSKGDRGILAQLSKRTSSRNVPYTAMSRFVELDSFTQVDGQEQVVSGSLVDVSTDKSIALDIKGTRYRAYKNDTGPSIVSSKLELSVQGLPGGNERGMFSSSADFILIDPPLNEDLRTGEMKYGTPLSGSWGISVLTRARFESQYLLPGSTGRAASLYGIVETIDPVDTSSANLSIAPRLSPVKNPKLNGTSLFTEMLGVGGGLVISWEPPASGTPGLYEVIVRNLYIDGSGNTRYTETGRIYTSDTQVKIPEDLMLEGKFYVLTIRAKEVPKQSDRDSPPSVSTPERPYRDGLPSASTAVNSAIIQIAP